jgi:biopolymer transport protein ExbD
VRSEINVTPLVDVVLVLLIIFMVVTPMLQKGPAVKLPVTENPERKPDEKHQILVAIESDGEIWLDKEKLAEAGFEPKIREAHERNPRGTVVIKGDARLEYGQVKAAMLAIKDAGFSSVGLIVEQRQAP